MSLTRQTQKVFGSNANANQLAVFGSMKTGTPVYSTNLATLQSTAYTQGWSEALLNDKAPYMEEMNAVQYGLSYQIAYMLQEGAFAYDANTNYSSTSIVKAFENGKMYFYHSLIDNNQGHALSDSTYWEKINISDTRNIGEIVQSAIPLTDAGLHLLDGSLLSGSGSYGAFVTYIGQLYTADPTANYFTTEADWQTSVSTYGVCGKFVYDSVNNTVRLPKYSDKIYTSDIASTVPVKGNGMTLGLTNGDSLSGAATLGTDNGITQYVGSYGTQVGTTRAGTHISSDKTVGITPDGSKSGIIADLSNITTSLDGYYYIVVATSTKTDIQVDIDEIATDLNGKADVDLSNTTPSQSFINMSINWIMPDYSAGVSVSSSPYTAPSDGVIIWWQPGETNNEVSLFVNGNLIYRKGSGSYSGKGFATYLPVSKNDIFTYSGWETNAQIVTFYPLKGV